MVEGGPDGAGMGDSEREAVDHQYYEEDENPYGTDLFARTDLFYGNPDEAIDGLDETHGGNFMGAGMHHHSSYDGGMDNGNYPSEYVRGVVCIFNTIIIGMVRALLKNIIRGSLFRFVLIDNEK